jgi:hypothetical protein
MRRLIFLAAIALAVLPAATASAQAARVKSVIDWNQPEESVAKAAETLSGALSGRDGKVIDLDLTVISREIPEGQEGTPDYNVTATTGQESAAVTCESTWERLETQSAFGITFNPAYNHLLLQILHAGPLATPLVTVACEYRGGSAQPVFHVRGRYVVSTISVPTAVEVQLRPVLGSPK